MLACRQTPSYTDALPGQSLAEARGKPSGMPRGFSTNQGGCIKNNLFKQLTLHLGPEMPPLAHMQGSASDHGIDHVEVDLAGLGIAEGDPAVMAGPKVIKAVVAARSKADAFGSLATSAILGLGFAYMDF